MLFFHPDGKDQTRKKIADVYEHYKGLMYQIAFDVLHSREEAEDAVHEAFVYIVQNPDKLRGPISAETQTWLSIIVKHKALDIKRKQSRIETVEYNESMAAAEAPSEESEGDTDLLALLPDRQREIMRLRYYNDYPAKDIAGMLDMNLKTVEKTITRAKKSLKRKLEEGKYDEA